MFFLMLPHQVPSSDQAEPLPGLQAPQLLLSQAVATSLQPRGLQAVQAQVVGKLPVNTGCLPGMCLSAKPLLTSRRQVLASIASVWWPLVAVSLLQFHGTFPGPKNSCPTSLRATSALLGQRPG